jgi:hypothetical protein
MYRAQPLLRRNQPFLEEEKENESKVVDYRYLVCADHWEFDCLSPGADTKGDETW